MEKINDKNLLEQLMEVEVKAPQSEFKTLGEILNEGEREAAIDEQTRVTTDKFLFPLSMGKLYTIVGITNVGKTWWSLATAVSLARELKDGKIGFLSTEDTEVDFWENLGETDVRDEINIHDKFIYKCVIETLSMDGFEKLLQGFLDEGCRIIVVDYLRPDMWEGHKDNANLTMGKFYQVYRNFLEKNSRKISIVQTVQANASLYAKDFYKQITENAEKVLTQIDGGYTASKRSHGVAFIVRLEKEASTNKNEKAWYFYIAKVKGHKYFGMNGQTYRYIINPKTFDIKYTKALKNVGKTSETEVTSSDFVQIQVSSVVDSSLTTPTKKKIKEEDLF
jgi:hypothetical protein